jgi:PAP2 superfamily
MTSNCRNYQVRSRLLIPLFVLAAAFSATSVSHADVVTQWNSAALAAIRANKTSPPRASRALAILHASIYDAINGITRSHESYFVQSDVPPNASIDAAGSAAAHVVLVSLFPAESTSFGDLHAAIMAAIPDSPRKRIGLEWGERVARQILAWRANDNADAVVDIPSGSGPGVWQPTPPAFAAYLLPQWAFVLPFALPASAFMRPAGPPSLDSPEWVADYNEVKALGRSVGSARTPEQSLIALFWADGAGTETPPGHWNNVAQRVSVDRRSSLEETARLFALLNIAMADAAICAWDAKYTYNFWRPVTAIRNGETDGNPATVGEPAWTSFIITPPFPDYVSGHSAFSGAAATVLAEFYGTDHIIFTVGSDGLPRVPRPFTSFTAAAKEAAMSRLYAGIHFRTAIEDGLSAGTAIGEWTVMHYLHPKGNRSRR